MVTVLNVLQKKIRDDNKNLYGGTKIFSLASNLLRRIYMKESGMKERIEMKRYDRLILTLGLIMIWVVLLTAGTSVSFAAESAELIICGYGTVLLTSEQAHLFYDADCVNGIALCHTENNQIYDKILQVALKDAQQRAQVIANMLHIKLGPVVQTKEEPIQFVSNNKIEENESYALVPKPLKVVGSVRVTYGIQTNTP